MLRRTGVSGTALAFDGWTSEVSVADVGPAAPLKGKYGDLMAGKALPITQARLRVGEHDLRKRVSPSDQEIVFETELSPGGTQLQSWFLDDAGELLAGAYYVEVERLIAKTQETDSASLCPPSDSSCVDQQK